MKAKLSILALGAMALVSSCSNDQTVDINDGNAIKFGVTAGKSSRAVQNGMTQLEGGFKVWAIDGENNKYIDGKVVSKPEGATDWTMAGGVKYWPQSSLSFFAIYPASTSPDAPELNLKVNESSEKTFNYTVTDGQTDVLYSSNLNLARPTATNVSSKVGLNFYHALSQIAFNVQNTKPNDIIVEVKGIYVKNVKSAGTFAWSAYNTDATFNDTQAGKWTTTDAIKTYKAWEYNTTTLNLIDNTKHDLSASANLFLMPQNLTPWYNTAQNKWNADGARVLVDCVIKDKDTGIQLWPKAGADADHTKVAISLPGTWLPGRKYTYTIVFGEGAGYDDTTVTPEDPTPDPVLVPISFEVSVSGFENGNGTGEELSGATN